MQSNQTSKQMDPKYKFSPVPGELKEYLFAYNGILAIRNFTARVENDRLILHNADDVNFSILDALVSEVEINGVVYDNPTDAQEALSRLTFNKNVPVLLTREQRDMIINSVQKEAGKGLSSNDFTNELKQKLEGLQPTDTSKLVPKGGYDGTGQELKDAIDNLQTKMGNLENTLSVDDTAFDTLQEIANQVKNNKNLNTLLTAKVDKEEGKGLSANDFTNELKEKLENFSYLSDNLIKINSCYPNSLLKENLQKGVFFTLERYVMYLGNFILCYEGKKLGEGTDIYVSTERIDDSSYLPKNHNYKPIKATLIHYEARYEKCIYLVNGEENNFSNSGFLKVVSQDYLGYLALFKFDNFPMYRTDPDSYVNYAWELLINEGFRDAHIGLLNLVDTKGNDTDIFIRYQEKARYTVMKVGNDVGNITFFNELNIEIEGNHKITGKAGSTAEIVCYGNKYYFKIHNVE